MNVQTFPDEVGMPVGEVMTTLPVEETLTRNAPGVPNCPLTVATPLKGLFGCVERSWVLMTTLRSSAGT